MVDVVEAYRAFAMPSNVRTSVAELLAAVPPEFLTGLKRVVLTNSGALSGARKRGRSWSRGRKARHADVAGLYHAAWQGQAAWIEIFVDRTLDGPPRWLLRLRLVRNLLLAFTLFHELGHHIHEVQRPEHKEQEAAADEWRHRLSRDYVRREHPLAWFVLRPIAGLAIWWKQRSGPSRRSP
jgi:hypothetical protein